MNGNVVIGCVGYIDNHRVTFVNLNCGTWILAIHSCDVHRFTVASDSCGFDLQTCESTILSRRTSTNKKLSMVRQSSPARQEIEKLGIMNSQAHEWSEFSSDGTP